MRLPSHPLARAGLLALVLAGSSGVAALAVHHASRSSDVDSRPGNTWPIDDNHPALSPTTRSLSPTPSLSPSPSPSVGLPPGDDRRPAAVSSGSAGAHGREDSHGAG